LARQQNRIELVQITQRRVKCVVIFRRRESHGGQQENFRAHSDKRVDQFVRLFRRAGYYDALGRENFIVAHRICSVIPLTLRCVPRRAEYDPRLLREVARRLACRDFLRRSPNRKLQRLGHAPTAELADIHRTSDAGEQKAWSALRAGEPERAMAHYHSRGRLHLADTRDQAAENAVQAWGQLTSEHDDIRSVALIADASNQEIDRLNARAQHLRAERGELGHQEITLPNVHYGLRDGDLIAFNAQHQPHGQPRIENGTRGQVTHVHERGVTITLDGTGRRVQLASEQLDSLRLAYAQHVYRQQGATVERSIVVTGGWQTSKETAYVEATRARRGTDWYIARDQLGDDGQDADRIKRLAQSMSHSRRQTPSLDYREATDLGWQPSRNPLRLRHILRPARWLTRQSARDAPDHSVGRGR